MSRPCPALICTIGLHGSASTWIFNVVRELLTATQGEAALLGCFADRLEQLPPFETFAGKILLVKSHMSSEELEAWLDEQGALRILSIRDPRDAMLSMMQRFKMPLGAAAHAIKHDTARLERLAAPGQTVWRYEDRFFDHYESVARLTAGLGLTVPETVQQGIFTRFTTTAVRDFAQSLASLPPERLTKVGPFDMDKVTQILTSHVGDGETGKWRRLPPPLQAELAQFYASFLTRFGYAG
jgi:hypothetical protein